MERVDGQTLRLALPDALRAERPSPSASPQVPFEERIRGALSAANERLQEGERAAGAMVRGEADSVDAMIALSRAELSLQHVVAFRDRALSAYQQIMRLRI